MELYCCECKKVVRDKDIVIMKGLNFHYDCWKKKYGKMYPHYKEVKSK